MARHPGPKVTHAAVAPAEAGSATERRSAAAGFRGCGGASEGDRFGRGGGAAHGGLVFADDLVGELVGVAGLDVPLPLGAVGVGHPGLDLGGVAADRVVDPGRLEAGARQAGLGGDDLVGGLGLDAEVVEGAAFGAFEQHELERWVGDGEVGVAGLALGRLGGEQLRVELDGLVDVGDVESELDAGHGVPPARVVIDDGRCVSTVQTHRQMSMYCSRGLQSGIGVDVSVQVFDRCCRR